MKISTFKHFTVDAFKSLKRNLTISFASVITVAATLFIFGVFLLVMDNANALMASIESKVEIKVFLDEDITLTDQRDIEVTLKNSTEVQEVIYESKSQALENMKEIMGEGNEALLSGYDENNHPFPAAFIVRLKSPEYANTVSDRVKDMPGVDSIGNDRELIEGILAISKALKWIGLFIFLLLGGVSLFLIVNTIRLTVFSRRREIGIMKFVGATDWFIRWPFVIEGVVIGVIGAAVSVGSLYYVYSYAVKGITSGTLIMIKLINPSYVFNTISWQFVAAGAAIGAVGSVIALRKFLVV
ncbi:permease-like cell division protein FtsX [Clostridium thermarum]|uniref:permease-like cell division protein FtsX n=1 Tax=Clostridium thermarum TaxID=1716543 RepID=UPI0013D1755E|nr:permease-like cell division protein FtsX [Clostridium thermarum]